MKRRPPRPSARQADFQALYERYGREVWAVAYARRMNADTALDVMQETYLRLWKQWEKGEAVLNPRAWLVRVARNLAEDHAKSAFSRNGTHPPMTMNGVRSSDPPPLERLEQQESFAQLRQVMEQLPEAEREILTLKYALDYSTLEIAALLGITAPAVHMRLSRARQRVAERLNAKGVEQAP